MNICILVENFDRTTFKDKRKYFIGDVYSIKGNLYIAMNGKIYKYKNTIILYDLLEIINSINFFLKNNQNLSNINISSYPEIELRRSAYGKIDIIHIGTGDVFSGVDMKFLEDIMKSIENLLLDFVRNEIPNLEELITYSILS